MKIWLLLIIAAGAGLVWAWQANVADHIQARAQAYIQQWWPQPSGNPGHKQVAYSFAILSDAHQDTHYFPPIVKAIAERQDLAFVAYLGDLSDAGDKSQLLAGKAVLDTINQPVYVLPGDHDYNWFPQHDLTNFKQVFGSRTYYSFNYQQQHFMLIDNSDLNNGISPQQWDWIEKDLKAHANAPIYVFMSTPVSNPYLTFKAMGSQSQAVKQQSVKLAQLLSQYSVKVAFAGDTHTFAQYQDHDTQLPIVTVGASGSTKNLLPLYVIVDIFSDGSYNATSMPYKQAIPVQGND
jgi:predicted phosphodiesterase